MISIMQREGILVVDSRLIAQDLGIEHESFMRTLKKFQTRVESRFGIIRLEIGEIKGRGQPEKYALLTEPQATALMTFTRNTEQVIECKLRLVEAFEKAKQLLAQPKASHQIQSPRWHRRLVDYLKHNDIADGRFCVFFETTSAVIAPLEANGYLVPDRLMPDISVGMGFSKHLKAKGYDLEEPGFRIRYHLRIPKLDYPGQWMTVQPWQYRNNMLGEFRDYVQLTWWPHQSLKYFTEKDPAALPAVHQRLKLPYYEQLRLPTRDSD